VSWKNFIALEKQKFNNKDLNESKKIDHVKIVVKLCREILRRVTRSVFFFLLNYAAIEQFNEKLQINFGKAINKKKYTFKIKSAN
jgi:CRISPR/Cas system-associated endoribonuclease Cas2